MKSSTLAVTTKIGCSINCTYCPQELLVKRYNSFDAPKEKLLSLDTFKKCINHIPKQSVVAFVGFCEPWLNPQCTDMVLYAHQKGFKISVSTTLVGMTEKDFHLLKDIPMQKFYIHLPGKDDNMNINITDEYMRVLKLFSNAKSKGKNYVTDYICHADDVHPALAAFVPDRTHGSNRTFDRAGNLKTTDNQRIESKQNVKGEIICMMDMLNAHTLLPNGLLVLCCMDYNMKHVLGSLLTQSWEEIHRSPEYARILNGMKDEAVDILCRNCTEARNVTELYQEYLERCNEHKKGQESAAILYESYVALHKSCAELQKSYESSTSWRITAPLRAFKKMISGKRRSHISQNQHLV